MYRIQTPERIKNNPMVTQFSDTIHTEYHICGLSSIFYLLGKTVQANGYLDHELKIYSGISGDGLVGYFFIETIEEEL